MIRTTGTNIDEKGPEPLLEGVRANLHKSGKTAIAEMDKDYDSRVTRINAMVLGVFS